MKLCRKVKNIKKVSAKKKIEFFNRKKYKNSCFVKKF